MARRIWTALCLSAAGLFAAAGLLLAQTADGGALSNFSTTLFAGSGDCASCHSGLADTAGQDVSFDTNWRASIMANSARDPLWNAKVESEVLRTPSLKGAIEETCSRCHMPMAHTQATADGAAPTIFGTGFLDPQNALHEAAMDGTSCALCHQIGSANLGDPATFDGHFPLDTVTEKDRSIYGKYLDPSVNKMSGNYIAVGGAHVEDPGLCATCHTLYTTAVTAAGEPVPGAEPFPEQTPYLEWEHSDFGDGVAVDMSCQECHMPAISGSARLAGRSSTPLRAGWGKHFFSGGNAFILSILRDNGADLGVTASTDQFNQAIDLTRAQLAEDTGKLAITSAAMTSNTQLTVDLQVSNLVGHKFPSGIPLRRAWIHLTATDENGQVIFESGAPLADGRIQGNNADANLATYEPHYDVITAADQVQIYEAIMTGASGDVTYTLLRATAFAKDNRLLPAGFDKSTAPQDIAVHGAAAGDDDFSGGGDAIRYEIPLADPTLAVTISARLLYQPLSYAAVQDLALDSTAVTGTERSAAAASPSIDRFLGYYAAANRTPDAIASAATAIAPPTTAVSGLITLQGRSKPGTPGTITLVDVDGNFSPSSTNFNGLSGAYALPDVPVLPEGSTYRIEVAHDLYLSNVMTDTIRVAPFTPSPTTLSGGDANLDLIINILDLACIGSRYGGAPGPCGQTGGTDINADGLVDIRDLSIAGGNYNLAGFQPW